MNVWLFKTKPKKQAKIIKYCISELANEREDKKEKVICLSSPKSVKKTSEKTCRATKKRERNKKD